MKLLRTPEAEFKDLMDYPFRENYIDLHGVRMHYIDEGPKKAIPIVLMHGVPTWSYLYRNMVFPLVSAGYRVIAPDLIGFGKSDKPTTKKDHSYQNHIQWTEFFMDQLELTNLIIFGQDWGSLIGMRLVANRPERFRAVIIGNGMLPTGEQKIPTLFLLWKYFTRFSPILPIGKIVNYGTWRDLTRDEIKGYNAPFPSNRYKMAIRALPEMVPMKEDEPESKNNRKAWEELSKFKKPFLTAFSKGDPITRGGNTYIRKRIPGAEGLQHEILKGGHFLQEDSGQRLSEIIIRLALSVSGDYDKQV